MPSVREVDQTMAAVQVEKNNRKTQPVLLDAHSVIKIDSREVDAHCFMSFIKSDFGLCSCFRCMVR